MKKTLVCFFALAILFSLAYAQDTDTTFRKMTFPIMAPEVEPPVKARIEPQRHLFLNPGPIAAPNQEAIPMPTWNLPSQFTPVSPPALGQMTPPSSKVTFPPIGPVTAPNYTNPYNPQAPPSFTFANVGGVNMVPQDRYASVNIADFSGGMNQTHLPSEIADNEAVDIQNFVWSESGMLEKRPGFRFRKENDTEFNAGERIWGLHAYYAPNGRAMLLAGTGDGKIYADTNESGTLVSVKTGLTSNEEYYDFETFKGNVIVTHTDDYPFWFDGQNTGMIGLADSGRGSLVLFEDQDSVNCASYILTGDTKITRILPRSTIERPVRRRIEDPTPTIYDRSNLTYYETDRWVGYSVKFVDTTGAVYWNRIVANEFDTLLLEGQNAESTLWVGNYYIYSYFDYDSLWSLSFYQGTPYHYCRNEYTAPGNCPSGYETWPDSGIVARAVEGASVGDERFIVEISLGVEECDFMLTSGFDSSGIGAPHVIVYHKTFWKPKLVEIYKNRIFFAGISGYPNLVIFSSYNALGDFPPDNYFHLKTQDGDDITVLATLYDDQLGYKDQSKDCLVILKRNSTWKLVFNSETDYYLVQVSPNVGCVAPQSIVNVEGRYLVFLHTSGVYAFDGRNLFCVSKKIQPTIEGINYNIERAAGGYYNRHYYLSFPTADSTRCNETIVFNTDLMPWGTIDNLRGNIFANWNPPGDTSFLLFSDWLDRSLIYEMGTPFTEDSGVAISLSYKSKAFDMNSMEDNKRFTYFDMNYNLPTGTCSTYFYTDFGDSLRYNTAVTDSGGYRYKRILLDSDCIGRNFSFAITSSNNLQLGKASIRFKKLKD